MHKKIAIFLPNLGGGGAERVALASAADLVGRGHEVDLVLVRAEGALLPLVPAGVHVIDLDAPRIVRSFWPLVRYLKLAKPDVIHAVMWPITVLAIIAVWLARGSTDVVVSEQVALSRRTAASDWEMALMRWSTRLLYPRVKTIIACSGDAAQALSELSEVPQSKIEVIFNPISPPAKIESTREAEVLWGGADERLITIGSLKRQKNQKLMIEAFANLRSRPRAKLMILGEGPLREELMLYAHKRGVASRLIMPGFFLDPWPFLASADLFVMSSDWEGFPLALAEGMCAGLKIVSTDCKSGPAEMLDGGRYGRLVPCGDADALTRAIDEELDEPPRPEELRARADEVAGSAMVHRYTELLTQVA